MLSDAAIERVAPILARMAEKQAAAKQDVRPVRRTNEAVGSVSAHNCQGSA